MQTPKTGKGSIAWKSILDNMNHLKKKNCVDLVNGYNIRFWCDNWMEELTLIDHIKPNNSRFH